MAIRKMVRSHGATNTGSHDPATTSSAALPPARSSICTAYLSLRPFLRSTWLLPVVLLNGLHMDGVLLTSGRW